MNIGPIAHDAKKTDAEFLHRTGFYAKMICMPRERQDV